MILCGWRIITPRFLRLDRIAWAWDTVTQDLIFVEIVRLADHLQIWFLATHTLIDPLIATVRKAIIWAAISTTDNNERTLWLFDLLFGLLSIDNLVTGRDVMDWVAFLYLLTAFGNFSNVPQSVYRISSTSRQWRVDLTINKLCER